MITVREATFRLLDQLGMTTIFGNPGQPNCRCSAIFQIISAMFSGFRSLS